MTTRAKKAPESPPSADRRRHDFEDAADFILSFSNNDLPTLLPGVEFPSLEFSQTWKNKNALFASLFQWTHWKAVKVGTTDLANSWPAFPIRYLEECDENRFLSALADSIERHLNEHHETVLRGTPDLEIPGFCSVRKEIEAQHFPHVITFRIWIAARWAVNQLDSSIHHIRMIDGWKNLTSRQTDQTNWKSDRLERTNQIVHQFHELWGLPRGETSLPDWFCVMPRSIIDLAHTMQKMPVFDTTDAQAFRSDHVFSRLEAEWAAPTRGRFAPDNPQTADPVAVTTVRALEFVLLEIVPNTARRRALIREILDATYPRDYLSSKSGYTPTPPSGRWPIRLLGDYARFLPRKLNTRS